MEIKAKLLEKFDTQQVSASFRKREFVVEYAENPQYPEFIKFELTQERCELMDGFNVNQELNVSFNLRGRKWTNPEGRVVYFNSLQAWRITAANDMASASAPVPAANAAPAQNVSDTGSVPPPAKEPEWLKSDDSEADDLPF